MKERLILN